MIFGHQIRKGFFMIKSLLRKLLYFITNILPVNQKKIFVNNFNGSGYGENPKYIVEEILNRNENFLIYWNINKNTNSEFPKKIKLVNRFSICYFYHLATSKIIINNTRNFMGLEKKVDQIYLQTQHGSVALKFVEKQAINGFNSVYIKDAKHDGKITDAIISANSLQTNQFKHNFWLNNKTQILEFGLPRNDVLLRNKNNYILIKNIKNKMKLFDEEKIILYAPTFRDDLSVDCYDLDFKEILKTFNDSFNKKHKILIRLHPNVAESNTIFKFDEEIVNVTYYPDIQELLLISDYLITDYSSTLFDFINLNKPVFLVTLDIEKYKNERGLVDDYFNLPFSNSHSNSEFINVIKNFNIDEYNKKIYLYVSNSKFIQYDDGFASKKVVDWLMLKLKNQRFIHIVKYEK